MPAGKMIPEDKLPIVGLSSVCGTDIGRYVVTMYEAFGLFLCPRTAGWSLVPSRMHGSLNSTWHIVALLVSPLLLWLNPRCLTFCWLPLIAGAPMATAAAASVSAPTTVPSVPDQVISRQIKQNIHFLFPMFPTKALPLLLDPLRPVLPGRQRQGFRLQANAATQDPLLHHGCKCRHTKYDT